MFNEPIEFSTLPVVYPWYEPHSSEEFSRPSADNVARSYLRQWYRLQVGDCHVALRPVDAEHNELWPEATEVPKELVALAGQYVLTWWNRAGHICDGQQRDLQTVALSTIVAERGWTTHPIAVFGDKSHWVEPGLVIDATEDHAIEAARALGQDVVVRLEATGVTVIRVAGDSGNYSVVSEEFVPLGVHVLDKPPCPMSRGPEMELPVKRQGGPGTSRGHSVAAMWSEFTRVAHSLVRCSVHKEFTPLSLEPGRAIALHEIAYSSRFGPMRFQKNKPFTPGVT
jgi:hypothetical protein